MIAVLPKGFQDLEQFLPDWVLPTERERKEKRATTSRAELVGFYDIVGQRITEIGQYLGKFPVGRLEAPECNLLHLGMMYMEVGIAVEFFTDSELPDAFPRARFLIADLPRPEDGFDGLSNQDTRI